MSGTICGILDTYSIEAVAASRQQYMFTVLYKFFQRMVTVGNAEFVALNYGNSGTGMDYHDEANPSGENAFFVVRLLATASTERSVDLYVLVQWAYAANFGVSPGDPCTAGGIASSNGVGMVMAFREDGGSPWAGTTNLNGADTKGTPVWTAGGSTLHVLNRSCSPASPAGSFNTNKEDLLLVAYASYSYMRMTVIGDADGFLILMNSSNTTTPATYYGAYFGIYTPRDGLTCAFPFMSFIQKTALPIVDGYGTPYGTPAGTGNYEGGIVTNYPGDAVVNLSFTFFEDLLNGSWQPNNQISPAELDEVPYFIGTAEGHAGMIGQLPTALLAVVGPTSQNTTNSAATRAYVGTTTVAEQWSIPWDAGSAPGSGAGRSGREL